MPLTGCTAKLAEFGGGEGAAPYEYRVRSQIVWPSTSRSGTKRPMRAREVPDREGLYQDVML